MGHTEAQNSPTSIQEVIGPSVKPISLQQNKTKSSVPAKEARNVKTKEETLLHPNRFKALQSLADD
ncbi:unnamed protein product [Arabidopsis halleri]